MSVINKMLRDLDARRAGGALPELQRPGVAGALLGTVSLGSPVAATRSRRWRTGLLATLLLVCAAGALWHGLHEQPLPPPPVAAAPAGAAAPALASASAPAVAPAVDAAPLPGAGAAAEPAASAPTAKAGASQPSTVALPAVVTRKPATPPPPPRAGTAALAAPDASRSRVAPPSAAPVTVPAAAAAPQPLQSAVLAATPAPGAGMAPSPPAVDATAAQRRQTAARATLAQAQALWNAGSREAALELVREALSLTERDRPVDTTVLATLAREQARMELAQGRPAVVLELLARLEPGLSEQADLWALRGNAAQRLGRHPEAVQAYQRALQLRGGEQRWLLGAAVSLAAQGQLEAAAQHTAQARALGPVSAEVMDYLRQAGVPLH